MLEELRAKAAAGAHALLKHLYAAHPLPNPAHRLEEEPCADNTKGLLKRAISHYHPGARRPACMGAAGAACGAWTRVERPRGTARVRASARARTVCASCRWSIAPSAAAPSALCPAGRTRGCCFCGRCRHHRLCPLSSGLPARPLCRRRPPCADENCSLRTGEVPPFPTLIPPQTGCR